MRIILILLALFSGTAEAQEFDKHRWKDRLLLICTHNYSNMQVQEQLNRLRAAREELNERKVKVYVISEENSWYNFSEQSQPLVDGKRIDKSFEVVLIGLDGGVKFRSNEVQAVSTFMQIIDSMPMRQAEIRVKNKR